MMKDTVEINIDVLEDCEMEAAEFDEELYQKNLQENIFVCEEGEGIGE